MLVNSPENKDLRAQIAAVITHLGELTRTEHKDALVTESLRASKGCAELALAALDSDARRHLR